MKAVQLVGYGEIDQLVYTDVPTPEPGPGEVLVKVVATSVNPIDWKLREGAMKDRWPLQFPAILGRDVAGETVKTGRKVMGLVNRSYAEYLVAKEEELAPVPEGLSMEQAGALPLVLLTGAQLIELAMTISPGQTILVTGALGGVGRAAVFVAKQHGAKVIAGVREKQKTEAAGLGADAVTAIDSEQEVAALPELDGIADTVGGEVIVRLLGKIKPGGMLGTVVGPPAVADGSKIRIGAFMAKPDARRLNELAQFVLDGKLKIPVEKRFSLKDAALAQMAAQKGGLHGKVLIVP